MKHKKDEYEADVALGDNIMIVNWSGPIGFGQLLFTYDKERDKMLCESEGLNRTTIAEILKAWAMSSLELDHEDSKTKVRTSVTREELNELVFPNTKNWLITPFYIGLEFDGYQDIRYHTIDGRVANVVIRANTLDIDFFAVNGIPPMVFVIGEIWSWE